MDAQATLGATPPPPPQSGAHTLVSNFLCTMLTTGLFSWAIAWTDGQSAGVDQGMWPLVLVPMLFVSALYSAVFALVAWRRPLPWLYILGFNAVPGLVLLIDPLLQYLQLPRPFSAAGVISRFMPHQWGFVGLLLLFLALHGIVLYLWRRADRR